MAQASALLQYDVTTNREDLTDIVAMISPEETPMFTRFKKTKATQKVHEWSTDSLANAGANIQIEGLDYTFTKPTAPSRVSNYCQFLVKLAEVSRSQQAANPAGIKDMVAYQVEKKMKEIKRDIEYALINSTGNSGASGTGRALTGVLSAITTNIETGTGTGSEALTETMYNNMLQTIFAAGGNPNATYVNSWIKRKISAFTTPNTRYQEPGADKKIVASVGIYESDFGVQEVILDRYMTTTVAALLDESQFAIAMYRPIQVYDVATIGSSVRKAIEVELTLEYGNEAASGKITGLSTTA